MSAAVEKWLRGILITPLPLWKRILYIIWGFCLLIFWAASLLYPPLWPLPHFIFFVLALVFIAKGSKKLQHAIERRQLIERCVHEAFRARTIKFKIIGVFLMVGGLILMLIFIKSHIILKIFSVLCNISGLWLLLSRPNLKT